MSRPAVAFPDAAALVAAALGGQLDDPVSETVPTPRPDRFVTVVRVGGPPRDLVTDAPLLAIECWGKTPNQAHHLARRARTLVHALPGTVVNGTTLGRVIEVGGLANLPDPVSEQPRYVFTVELAVRGARP